MTAFLAGYIGVAVLGMLSVYGLSYSERPQNKCRVVLLIVYILSIVGVLFATGVLEVRFGWNRLYSTLIAAGVLVGVYFADTLGKRAREHKEK